MNDLNLQYILKHKDISVMFIAFSKQGEIQTVNLVTPECVNYIPVGYRANKYSMNNWWRNRKVLNQNKAIIKNLGLSMTDCYWICPVGSNLMWQQVSLYRNDFVDTANDLHMLNVNVIQTSKFKYTPHSTTKGEMLKKWFCLPNLERILVKGTRNNDYQQCVNECFAADVHSRQKMFAYTTYVLWKVQVKQQLSTGCVCNSFCNEQKELFTYWDLIHSGTWNKNEGHFDFAVRILSDVLGNREYVERWFSYLFLTDFILSNTDRHMENIGFLRNADTLQILDFAPIFDTGNSMFWNAIDVPQGTDLLNIHINSFCSLEREMFQFVKYFDVLNLTLLPTDSDVFAFYKNVMSEERLEKVIKAYNYKIDVVRKMQECGSALKVLTKLNK